MQRHEYTLNNYYQPPSVAYIPLYLFQRLYIQPKTPLDSHGKYQHRSNRYDEAYNGKRIHHHSSHLLLRVNAKKRAALKEIVNKSQDPVEAYEAARKLQAIPRNANPIRLHNRCKLTGRPKGYIRLFGLSRIQFREMASSGLIPGVKKASW